MPSRFARARASGLWLPNREIVRPRNPLPAPFVARPRDARSYKPGSVFLGYGGGHDGTLYGIIEAAGLLSNLVLCLDAGDAASYTSGQSWLDRSGGGYDFFLGADGSATATDPTFNGTAGGKSSGEYFSFDGGDYFTYDTSNETWMNNLHKNNAAFTFLCGVYFPSGGESYLWGTCSGVTTTIGCNYYAGNDAGYTQTVEVLDGAAPASLIAQGDSTPSGDAWHVLGVSLDEAGGTGFHYLDGGYNQVSAADTFTATYSGPSASNASSTMKIGANGAAGDLMDSGSRLGFIAFWSAALTKAQLDLIWADIRIRYGI